MKRTALIIIAAAGLLLSINHTQAQTPDTTSIRKAILQLKETYPQATLQDIYKTFYQDHFGPEHLITDPASVRHYLMREIAEYDQPTTLYFEPTGSEGRFVRVYLSAIADSLVTAEQLLDAFLRSAEMVEKSQIDWATQWSYIVSVVIKNSIPFADFEEDIDILSEAGQKNVAMRHSNAYNAAYHPHYRIVARQIFENEIRPLVEGKR